MAFMFEKLDVYQKSVDFADQVAALSQSFPRGFGFLSGQLNRAALSISANIAEGNGRSSKADRRHFFVISRGSAQECVPLLEVSRRRGLIKDKTSEHLLSQLEVIAKMLSGLIKGINNRKS